MRALRVAATAAGGVLAFAAPVQACPYCALSQGSETLVYILGFLLIPYVIVSTIWLWMRRLMAREATELGQVGGDDSLSQS